MLFHLIWAMILRFWLPRKLTGVNSIKLKSMRQLTSYDLMFMCRMQIQIELQWNLVPCRARMWLNCLGCLQRAGRKVRATAAAKALCASFALGPS